jgi:hypothetical protein
MNENEIWRAAHKLIERHANMAEPAAAMEVDRFIERGDPAGEAKARRVVSAIKALRRGAGTSRRRCNRFAGFRFPGDGHSFIAARSRSERMLFGLLIGADGWDTWTRYQTVFAALTLSFSFYANRLVCRSHIPLMSADVETLNYRCLVRVRRRRLPLHALARFA